MHDTKKYLGSRIQEIRKSKKITQEELAELLNVDSKHISKIECGRCFPSFELLDKIALAFNVEPYELLENSHLKSREKLIEEITDILNHSCDSKLKNIYVAVKNLN